MSMLVIILVCYAIAILDGYLAIQIGTGHWLSILLCVNAIGFVLFTVVLYYEERS